MHQGEIKDFIIKQKRPKDMRKYVLTKGNVIILSLEMLESKTKLIISVNHEKSTETSQNIETYSNKNITKLK